VCTPVGHTLAGYAASGGIGAAERSVLWKRAALIIGLANLPDADFLFGVVTGNPNQFHHLWTHSIGFVLLVVLVAWTGAHVLGRSFAWKTGLLAGGLVLSHLVTDLFTVDWSEPTGMQALWPFSRRFFIAPMRIFPDVVKASSTKAFLGSLICWHNARTLAIELAIFGPPSLWIWLRRRKQSENLK